MRNLSANLIFPTLTAATRVTLRIGFSLLLVVLAIPRVIAAQGDGAGNTAPQISVHLTSSKRIFSVAEPIAIKIRIENVGDKPVLIANFVSIIRNMDSHIEFGLRDTHGRMSPSLEANADNFSSSAAANPANALLGSWLLLKPGYSLAVDVTLGKDLFEFLGKPGKYRLSATYSSNGLLYPPVYRAIGLTDEEVQSVPFQSWKGKISTNTLNLEIVPVKAK